MSRSQRTWLLLVAAIVIVILVIGGGGQEGPPYDPRSVSPDGARGVVETLERLGAEVTLDRAVPESTSTTALVLQNRLTVEDEDALERWVRDGGVLVVADLTVDMAAAPRGFLSASVEAPINRGSCTIDALGDAIRLTVGGRLLETAGRTSCFGDRQEALIVAELLGQGTVVTVGTPDLFINQNLDDQDAAVVALSLLAPDPDTAQVTFVAPSLVDFGEQGLSDLVPRRVTNAIAQLLAAFLLYALYRSRRLGAVVAEPVPVRIEGSELVLRAGQLSQRAKDPPSAAAVIRGDFMQRARRALSMSPDTAESAIIDRIVDATGSDPETVDTALIKPVHTDTELTDMTLAVAELDLRLFGEPTTDSRGRSGADQPNRTTETRPLPSETTSS